MGIEFLVGDGVDYHILEHAVMAIKGVPGLICEIGLREGGGTKTIMDTLLINGDLDRTCIAIDPYGCLPYRMRENNLIEETGFSNTMMKRTLHSLYWYIENLRLNFTFFQLEDTEFFKRYGDGIPVYDKNGKHLINQYALVYFDGPHSLKDTMDETLFFMDKVVPGSIFVYDDVTQYYDHKAIYDFLLTKLWKLEMATKHKAYYRYVG